MTLVSGWPTGDCSGSPTCPDRQRRGEPAVGNKGDNLIEAARATTC
jgi:hypothetical protein